MLGTKVKIDGTNSLQVVSKINHINYDLKTNSQDEAASQNVGDKLEISEEAKFLISNKIDTKKFAEIQQKIKSGFYNSDEVLNKVADSLLKELKQ